jgi:hypothetical protein
MLGLRMRAFAGGADSVVSGESALRKSAAGT